MTDSLSSNINGGPGVSTYLLWVNEERTILVRWWPDNSMEVATRSESGAIWGPPVKLEMEAQP